MNGDSNPKISLDHLDKREVLKRRRERIAIALISLLIVGLTFLEIRLTSVSITLPFVNSIFFFGLLNVNLILIIALVWLVFRNLGKLLIERRQKILGSRLKTKLVIAFLAFALVPTLALFTISSLYINSSFDKWFSLKIQNTLQASLDISRAYYTNAEQTALQFATHPEGVTEPAQYGSTIKAHSVYMSQFQLVPLARVEDHFRDQLGLPISKGSISNWNVLAYKKLESFEQWARSSLISSLCNNADETGINVGGKRLWLHSVSNETVTLFHPDEKRGQEAMDRMGVIPFFTGVLIHDHWKPYFGYSCIHALCNAHHLRELEAAIEFDGQRWAKKMQKLLIRMRDAVDSNGGAVSKKVAAKLKRAYRRILKAAELECPENRQQRAQTKSRNLLERLRNFENETLRFLEDSKVPFTNNRGENDIRMTKVQQKISGCFRSMEGAKVFCRVRSYLSTCRKNGVGPSEALKLLFDGKSPSFMK